MDTPTPDSHLQQQRTGNKRKHSTPFVPDPYKSQNSTTAPIYNRTSTPKGVVVKQFFGSNSSIRTYYSISEACRHTGISRNAITNICHAGGGQVGHCHLRFESEDEEEDIRDCLANAKTQHKKVSA